MNEAIILKALEVALEALKVASAAGGGPYEVISHDPPPCDPMALLNHELEHGDRVFDGTAVADGFEPPARDGAFVLLKDLRDDLRNPPHTRHYEPADCDMYYASDGLIPVNREAFGVKTSLLPTGYQIAAPVPGWATHVFVAPRALD